MKFSRSAVAVAALAFAGLADAQSQCLASVTAIPACALGYIADFAYSSFSCDIVDFACQCSHTADLLGPLSSALQPYGSACDVNSVAQGALSFCNSCVKPNAAQPSVTLESYQKQCEPSAIAIPPCALGFLASAGIGDGCQINDFGCQCSQFDMIEGQVAGSVLQYCSSAGVALNDITASASSLCACVTSATGGGNTSPNPTGVSPTTTGTAKPSSPITSGPIATNGTSKAPSGTSQSGAKPTTTPSSPGGGSGSLPTFTGAGATASVFGGAFGIIAGLAAFL